MKVILDSGAYTMSRKKVKIDIDQYAEFVKKHSNVFCHYFNMDKINDGEKSYENWHYLKSKGVETIPVFHIGTSERFLRLYLEETNYIGLGAIANLSSKKRLVSLDYIWKKYLLDEEGNAKYKVHGLGLTALPIMKRQPWFSVDSFTPIISAAWGGIILPVFRDGDPDYENIVMCKISDQANHKVGTQISWPNMPSRFRKQCEQLMEKMGFKVGNVHYQKQRARRGKKLVEVTYNLFNLTTESEDKETLAGNWVVRARWNLKMWEGIVSTFKENKYVLKNGTFKNKCNVFVGVSTDSILDILKDNGSFDILVSYAYYNNETKVNSLKEATK
jgi:hypothetical protein